ncbi:MAG: glycosyltransferase family 2 protein [Pseudonocardiales bacterium]|nr:glycosyltransferase family 2 protein [Pseudonocardiales bacterium]
MPSQTVCDEQLIGVAATDRRGGPWVLLALLGVSLVASGLVGEHEYASVLTVGLQAVFLMFFIRHLAFVEAAARTVQPRSALDESGSDAEGDQLVFRSDYTPQLSVLVACHNEERVLDRLKDALRAFDYPSGLLQLIVIDDGSSDRTGELLDYWASEDSNLLALHRPAGASGGKSGALNAALSHVSGEVVVVFDADHRPRPDVPRRLARHFADLGVGAVQGCCRILNGEMSLIGTLVEMDYLAGYLVNEFGRQAVFRLPAYGGANCAVRTASLRAVGGWNENSVTEDTDLTLRLVLTGQRIRYDVTAVDEEEAVTTLRCYWVQRYRWARGHQQVWRDYRGAVWRSSRLSLLEKIETTMFLFVFHVPVFSFLGIGLLIAGFAGLTPMGSPLDQAAAVFWTLLFLGPLLELSTGLLLSGAARRKAFLLVFFLPLFFVSMVLCTKAWLDGVLDRRYSWAKTARTGGPPLSESEGGPAYKSHEVLP